MSGIPEKLQPIKYIPWKGKTFTQLSTSIRFNNRTQQYNNSANSTLFRPLPLKIHRREIAIKQDENEIPSQRCNVRTSVTIDELMRPNGYIIYSNPLTTENTDIVNTGLGNVLDLQITTDTTNLNTSSCNTSQNCINQAAYARRRVRSSGMIQKKFNLAKNNDRYYTDNIQYLKNRNKSFEQNQFNYLKQGSTTAVAGTTAALQNVYASNGLNHCSQYYISSQSGNNTFSYIWIDGLTYTVTIPDDYYDFNKFNGIFQSAMIQNQHYYISTQNLSKQFLLSFTYDLNTSLIQMGVLAYSSFNANINYTIPDGTTWNTSPSQNAQFIIPSSMTATLGFPADTYPATPQIIDYYVNSSLNHELKLSFTPVYYKRPQSSIFL